MEKWVTAISRAFMMGLAWATVWVPVGMLAGQRIVGELEPEHHFLPIARWLRREHA